jgi:ParB family chromosome partitioning protein
MSRATLISSVTEARLADITISDDRLRPTSDAAVSAIADSIREHGLIYPIVVRRLRAGGFELVDGGHRLAAMASLSAEVVPVRCYDGPAPAIRLIEIDTNLARADLSDLDRSIHLAARRREYLAEHPETAQGRAGAAGRWDATAEMALASFVTMTAQQTGLDVRKIHKFVAAGAVLDKVTAERLRSAPKRVFLNDILALAKAPPALRPVAVEAFSSGSSPKIAAALKAAKGVEAPIQDPVDQQLKALKTAWARAGAAARRRWLEDAGADVAALMPRPEVAAE